MTERNRTDKLEAPSNAIGKILSFIRERRYQPSERLPSERDFAEKFDTSRGAVREGRRRRYGYSQKRPRRSDQVFGERRRRGESRGEDISGGGG